MKTLSNKPENTAWAYILAFLLILLAFSCGTKTKTFSESESKDQLTQEQKIAEENRKKDSVRVLLEEALWKKFAEQNSEKTNTEATKTTTTEVTEVIKSPTADFKPVPGTDLFLNYDNGKVLERKTKTIIEERFNQEQLKLQQIELEQKEQRKKDSIVAIEVYKNILTEQLLQFEAKQKQIASSKEKKGWEPSLLQIIGLSLVGLGLIASIISWLKFSTPFAWILFFFRRKKQQQNES